MKIGYKDYLKVQNSVLLPLQLIGALLILFAPSSTLLVLGILLVTVPTIAFVYFNLKFKDVAKEEGKARAIKLGLDVSDQAQKLRKNYSILIFGIFLSFIILTFISPSFNDGYYIIPFMYVGIVILIFGSIGISIADHAQKKGKNWTTFFWLSLLISPLVTGLIVATINPEQGKILSGTKACPKCAEPVKTEAILCKHCGSDI